MELLDILDAERGSGSLRYLVEINRGEIQNRERETEEQRSDLKDSLFQFNVIKYLMQMEY